MFTNQDCMRRMVGGAAIGVAVGMYIQKIISPRLTERSPLIAVSASPKPCKCAKKLNNQHISSHRRKKHCHCRSKSAGDKSSKHSQKEISHLSFPKKSSDKSKRNSRESDRRLGSQNHEEVSRSDEESKPIEELTNTYKFTFDTSTQYLPIAANIHKGISPPLLFDINNRKINSKFSINRSFVIEINNLDNIIGASETQKKNTEMSTEYKPIASTSNLKSCEEIIPSLITNNQDLKKLGTEQFLTLPTFNESIIPAYTKHDDE